MSNATDVRKLAGNAGSFMIRLAHGGLLITGVVAAVHLVATSLQHDAVSFADTGLLAAHAAVLEPRGATRTQVALFAPGDTGNSWKVAPDARFDRFRDREAPAVKGSDAMALSDEMQRVRDWVSRRYRVSSVALAPVLVEAEHSARKAGLDPLLIVAMMAIESSFNPYAESNMGAQGLMQVIPRWHMDKIGEDAGDDALFDPLFNVQIGVQVLVEGLQRYGTLQAALQYYGGARKDPEARYSKRVLAMKQRISAIARSDGDT